MHCTATSRNGTQCKRHAIPGATVCHYHGGNAPQVKAHAAIRAEALRWQPGTPHADPTETLLRLLTQSWARTQQYAGLLEHAVDQAGGDMAAALVGDIVIATPTGDTVKSGEYIRGLATLEAQERERAAKWSAQAIAAGVAERQVRLAERQGQLLADVLRAVLGDPTLGLTADQRAAVPAILRTHLQAITAG